MWCEATGKAFHVATDKRSLPTVGDWVLLERWSEALEGHGNAVIREILPRRNLLVRKAAGEASIPQPLAANVDLGLVMTSANSELSAPRLDRYLNLLRDGGIPAAIVLSKIDLVEEPLQLVAQVMTSTPDVLVVPLSLVSTTGLDDLRALVRPRMTAVLLGSSGVGKSTLLNALLPEAVQATREIRDDDKGRHTTTRRELFVASDGSLWIDTPGMRELGRWANEDDEEEEDAFDDIDALAGELQVPRLLSHRRARLRGARGGGQGRARARSRRELSQAVRASTPSRWPIRRPLGESPRPRRRRPSATRRDLVNPTTNE